MHFYMRTTYQSYLESFSVSVKKNCSLSRFAEIHSLSLLRKTSFFMRSLYGVILTTCCLSSPQKQRLCRRCRVTFDHRYVHLRSPEPGRDNRVLSKIPYFSFWRVCKSRINKMMYSNLLLEEHSERLRMLCLMFCVCCAQSKVACCCLPHVPQVSP